MTNRRIWDTPSDTVCLRDTNALGEEVIREFWVAPNGGCVREIDEQHPGAFGKRVCERLRHLGKDLNAHAPWTLEDVIRREYRRREYQLAREMGKFMGRKPQGDRALTQAERQARLRVKRHTNCEILRKALEEIATARLLSTADARAIAAEALAMTAR